MEADPTSDVSPTDTAGTIDPDLSEPVIVLSTDCSSDFSALWAPVIVLSTDCRFDFSALWETAIVLSTVAKVLSTLHPVVV